MTNNLNWPQVADNQDQKETTINTALGRIDASLTDVFGLSFFAGDNTASVDTDDMRSAFQFDCTPDDDTPADGDCTLTFASGVRRGMVLVTNATGQDLTVQVDGQGGSPPTISDGQRGLIFIDGAAALLL